MAVSTVEGEALGPIIIGDAPPEPKRRGRPPKSQTQGGPEAPRAAPEAPEGPSEVEVVQEPPKRRGRAPGAAARGADVAQAAPLLVTLTDQVCVAWLGPECAMLPQEKGVLTPSVGRVLARLPRGAAEQVSLYTDPFVILIALGLWARRIASIKEQQARYAQLPVQEQQRASGYSGTEYTVPENVREDAPVVPFRPEVEEKPVANGVSVDPTNAIFSSVIPT